MDLFKVVEVYFFDIVEVELLRVTEAYLLQVIKVYLWLATVQVDLQLRF